MQYGKGLHLERAHCSCSSLDSGAENGDGGVCMVVGVNLLDSKGNYCATSNNTDFSVNRVLMKLFRSSNIEIIAECRNHFGVELPRLFN